MNTTIAEQIKNLRILKSAASKLKVTYKIYDGIVPVQSKKYQSEIMNAAIVKAIKEYWE